MNSRFAGRLRRSILAVLIVYWICLVLGTHWAPREGPQIPDKVLHLTAYAGLTVLLAINVFWNLPGRWWWYGVILAGVAAFAGIDELTQPPFGRSADWYDWYADLAGIAIGLAAGAI